MVNGIVSLLAGKLGSVEPLPKATKLASVAVVLQGNAKPEMLLIKRAEMAGDPWSGQIAFPGGKMQAGDVSLNDTAARETMEELGVDLHVCARFLGYFGSFRTHTGTLDVIPSVYALRDPVEFKPNEEVSAFRWVPVSVFTDPKARTLYHIRLGEADTESPAFAAGDWTVWGLTYRIISNLVSG